MDYEKLYKEALERAKDYYKANQKIGESKENEVLSDIFPELKESEDERMKQAILGFLEGSGMDCELIPGIKIEDAIAWLEKKEPVEEIVERCKNSWYNEGKIAGQFEGLTNDEKYQQGWHDAMEAQSEEFDDNIITRDDEVLQAISVGLTDAEEAYGWSDFGGIPIEEIQDWLEKQKKFNWSEEDETMLDSAIGAVWAADYYTYDDKTNIEQWLKSLKDRLKGG